MYTKKDLILHAKNYIDKLSEGINPLTDLNVDDADVIKDERIVKCFQHISTWLYEYAQQLKKEEFVAVLNEYNKKKKKQPKNKSSIQKAEPSTSKPTTTVSPIPTQSYTIKTPKKSCETCKHYKNNNCGGLKLCNDYEHAPTFSAEETVHWPKEGDATYFKRTGRSRN